MKNPRFVCCVMTTCLGALCVLLSAPAVGQDTVSATDLQRLAEQMNETELSMRWFDKLRDRARAMHRRADEITEILHSQNRGEEAAQLEKAKHKIVLLHRDMPNRRRGLLTTVQEMITYKNQTLPGTVAELKEIAATLEEYNQKIASGELKPLTPAEATTAEAEALASADFEAYITALSGDVRFYINGRRVSRVGQALPADDIGAVHVKAMVMGDQRKRALDFEPTERTTSWDSDPYYLNYKAALPDGSTGETTWEVMTETYTWSIVPSGGDGTWKIESSGVGGVKRDIAVLSTSGATTFKIRVEGQSNWETTYKTHGKPLDRTDKGSGEISIAIAPR